MANFFNYTAVYDDGTVESGSGIRLYYLGGIKDEAGHALLAKLRANHAAGIIVSLSVDYES
jgi:hypothetical protein